MGKNTLVIPDYNIHSNFKNSKFAEMRLSPLSSLNEKLAGMCPSPSPQNKLLGVYRGFWVCRMSILTGV